MSEPIGYIPDVGLKTLTDEKKFCVVNATKFDETDIPLYTTPQDQSDRIAELEKLCKQLALANESLMKL